MSKSCEHLNVRSMTWPDNGQSDVCLDCLLTRHHCEFETTEWQNHSYELLSDWYGEATELCRSIESLTNTP